MARRRPGVRSRDHRGQRGRRSALWLLAVCRCEANKATAVNRRVVATKTGGHGSQIIQEHALVMLDCGDMVHKDKAPAIGTRVDCATCDARAKIWTHMPEWERDALISEFVEDPEAVDLVADDQWKPKAGLA